MERLGAQKSVLPGWRNKRWLASSWAPVAVLAILFCVPHYLSARGKDPNQYGAGLIINVPFPENQVIQVVQDVVQNGIIRGTKEYTKDEYVTGAEAQSSVRVFPAWTGTGKVFYKVRAHALDPRNFKDSGDVGTLAVRYVVEAQGDKNSVLHIDAIFVEDFRRTLHLSNGSVETAEYKNIRDHLDAISVMQTQAAEIAQERKEQAEQKSAEVAKDVPKEVATASDPTADTSPLQPPVAPSADSSGAPLSNSTSSDSAAGVQTLEDHVKDLRRQLQRTVKAPGAPLKSAPFHTASTLQSLPSGTEVLIVITTPYWLGVETHEGQHGWMLRDDLELVP